MEEGIKDMKREIKAGLITLFILGIISLIAYGIYLHPMTSIALIVGIIITSVIRSIYLSILEES